MMKYNGIIACILCMLSAFCLQAQELSLVNVGVMPNDKTATEKPKYDFNDNVCAVIKVYAPVKDAVITSSYIVDSDNMRNGEGLYVLYIAEGVKSLSINKEGFKPMTVEFGSLKIKGGVTYEVELEINGGDNAMEHDVIFNISEKSGTITIDDVQYRFRNNTFRKRLPVGEHTYLVSSEGCISDFGTIQVQNSSEVVNVILDKQEASVNFVCNIPDAVLRVDGIDMGTPGMKSIPLGKHYIFVSAGDCHNYSSVVSINKLEKEVIDVELKTRKDAVGDLVIIKNQFKPGLNLYVDNKMLTSWKVGEPVKLKYGRHLISVGVDGRNRVKEKVMKIVRGKTLYVIITPKRNSNKFKATYTYE